MIRRLLTRLAAAVAPLGFQCDRCGFLEGDSADEHAHREMHRILDAWWSTLSEAKETAA